MRLSSEEAMSESDSVVPYTYCVVWLPVELLTPAEPEHVAGILAFRHPRAEEVHRHLHARNIHVMSHAGRLRVAVHGYNTAADVERFVRELRAVV